MLQHFLISTIIIHILNGRKRFDFLEDHGSVLINENMRLILKFKVNIDQRETLARVEIFVFGKFTELVDYLTTKKNCKYGR